MYIPFSFRTSPAFVVVPLAAPSIPVGQAQAELVLVCVCKHVFREGGLVGCLRKNCGFGGG